MEATGEILLSVVATLLARRKSSAKNSNVNQAYLAMP